MRVSSRYIAIFILLIATLFSIATAPAVAQSTGYSMRAPVVAASCRICPWGALADLLKKAVASSHWDIQVCYSCAGGPLEIRNVEAKAMPPKYDPSRLLTIGAPVDELAYLSPPPPSGPADFGITTTNALWWAYQGTHDFAKEPPYKDLRLIATIPSPMYLIVAATKASGITDLGQLKGKPVRILWDVGSGQLDDAAPLVLAYYGITSESILAAGGTIASGVPIANRRDFDVVIYLGDLSSAPEFSIWYQISQQFDLNYLRLPDALLSQLVNTNDMVRMTAPAGFLRGVWEPIPTVGYLGNVIYGRTDMPDQFAYDLAKAIDERKDLLETAYQHFFYNPQQVWRDYGVPLAPGAERYYRAKGYLMAPSAH